MSTWLHNKEVYCKLLEEPGEPRIRRISPSGISVGIGQTRELAFVANKPLLTFVVISHRDTNYSWNRNMGLLRRHHE